MKFYKPIVGSKKSFKSAKTLALIGLVHVSWMNKSCVSSFYRIVG